MILYSRSACGAGIPHCELYFNVDFLLKIMKVQEFLTYCEKRNLRCLTVRNYRQHLKDFYIFLQGQKDMDEVTSKDLLEFISEQAETVSARSVNIKMASLRVYFDFLCRFHGLQLNPTLAIAKCKEEKKLPRYIPQEKIDALWNACPRIHSNSYVQRQSFASFI